MEKKKRQHHVWKHHLGAWATDGQLCCMMDNRVFRAAPVVLAVESEYYRQPRLDERDLQVLRQLCVESRGQFHAEIAEAILAFLNDPHVKLDHLQKVIPGVDVVDAKEMIEVNQVENLYALIESKMVPILRKLRERDLSSVNCPEEAQTLVNYLATQYFRTKSREAAMNSVLDGMTEDERSKFGCNWESVWGAMRLILACQVGLSMCRQLNRASWTILQAPEGVELITSDQPLFNTKAHDLGADGFVKEFIVYFPICPEFALLCDMDSTNPGMRTEDQTEDDARHYNQRMLEESFQQVFARRQEELEVLVR